MMIAWTYGLIGAAIVIGTAGVVFMILQLVLLFRKRLSTPILPCTWIKTVDLPTSKSKSYIPYSVKVIEI